MAPTTTTQTQAQAPSKKRKRSNAEETNDAPTDAQEKPTQKKKKQRTRKPRDVKPNDETTVAAQDPATSQENPTQKKKKTRTRKPRDVPKPNDETPAAAQDTSKKTTRFIVFIGNLPYTATKAAVEKHFSAVEPTSVRLNTMKDNPSKCKGFAFLEFGSYDKMELCLTKFHHSMFSDGKSEARKINVELTAGGGGGKSKVRREKLMVKNEKLNEERQRVATDRVKEKAERHAQAEDVENGMHPSRRRRIQ
ncbi:hypothetical protein K440DRAFT_543053 [Wilcoxina mikolae CBS 423.85]|nr:hypothetical protein K440DRAFT_543053 [Wilcoxina mikolae CBS 423.85]